MSYKYTKSLRDYFILPIKMLTLQANFGNKALPEAQKALKEQNFKSK